MNIFVDLRFQSLLLIFCLLFLSLFSIFVIHDYISFIGDKVLSKNALLDFQFNLVFYWLIGFFLILIPFERNIKSIIIYSYIFRFIFLNTITIGYLFIYSSDKGFSVISLDEMFYFLDSIYSSSDKFGYVGSGLVTRINYTLSILFPENYFLFRSIFGFFSFIGITLVWKALSEYYSRRFLSLLFILMFFPSLTFWSLNMGKEPIMLLGLGIYFLGHLRLMKKITIFNLLTFILGLAIIAAIRPWVILIIAPGIALSLLYDERVKSSMKLSLVSGALIIIPLALTTIVSMVIRGDAQLASEAVGFSLDQLFSIVNKFISEGTTSEAINNPLAIASSVKEINSIFDLINPWKMFSAIFRPLPGEAGGPIGFIVGLESLLLLFISIIASVRLYIKKNKPDIVCLVIISHILFWSILYGALLDFNWGYHFRQKVIILPFILSLIYLLGANQEKSSHYKNDTRT